MSKAFYQVLCILSFSVFAQQKPAGHTPRIVGGTFAIPHQFPFFAWLRITSAGGQLGACGGSLVSPNYILTAAHCCFCNEAPPSFEVYLNLQHVDPFSYYGVVDNCTEMRTTTERKCHPNYHAATFENDFCLLHLSTPSVYPPITVYDSTRQVISPRPDATDSPVLIVGFGTYGVQPVVSDTLKKAEIFVADTNECNAGYVAQRGVGFDTSLIICGNTSTHNDTCSGDSGGPFLTKSGGKLLLLGVTSSGVGNCADPTLNGLYGRVDTPSFRNWAYELYPTTKAPTSRPTRFPTSAKPSKLPTLRPSRKPSREPTSRPTRKPSNQPTTRIPTLRGPTTRKPTKLPTTRPTRFPTSWRPSKVPTTRTLKPSRLPTQRPTGRSRAPTRFPTTRQPTFESATCINTQYP